MIHPSVSQPLTASEVDGIRYRAETATDPAALDTLRVTLSVANVGTDRVLILGAGNVTCPSQLYGYRSAARRDRWYLEWSVDWVLSACPLRVSPTWLEAGETRTFSASVSAQAGQAGAGRYYLVLVLWLDREPPGRAGRIVLAAGEATLSGR